MHKCNNCGEEFEGKFCPNCGAGVDQQKTCPNCGETLADKAKFCNQCGYSFEGKATAGNAEKKPSAVKSFFAKAWAWIKTHKKIVIPVAAFIVVAIILLSLIPTFILASKNGTYYSYDPYSDKIDKESYIILNTGKWKDEDGESGTYKVNGDKVTFYVTVGGSKEELFTGTLKNGVLKYGEEGAEEIYVSDKHNHSYGGWKENIAPTCTEEGNQKGTCVCGRIEERVVNATGHSTEYVLDFEMHKTVCVVCNEVFEEKEHLPNVNLSNGCTICGELKTIIIADGITTVPGHAFNNCVSLSSIVIPDSVTSIGFSAFSNCRGLKNIYYKGDIASWCKISGLDEVMSSNCKLYIDGKELMGELVIPDGVTSIGDGAFKGCSGLTSVTISDSVTSIGDWAFRGCSGLKSITIPDGVTSIGSGAFSDCSGLKSITIPEGVTSIEYSEFSGCCGLKSITIPEGVTSIGSQAFKGCSGLTSVTISDSVTSIGGWAFEGCINLIQTENGVQYVDKWGVDCDTSVTEVTLRSDTKGIGSYVFSGCSGLKSITIPEGVTSISSHAFDGCSGLTSIVIPDGVTSIGFEAFRGCSGLTSVTISDSVTSIGDWAFEGCPIETATIPAVACRYIRNDKLKLVTITSGDSLEYGAFDGCSGLTSVTIPDGVTSIGDGAFKGCSGLTSVTISDSVTSIGDWAFYNCSGLTSIVIPDGVTSIGYKAFYGCSGLETIYCETDEQPGGWDSMWYSGCSAQVVWGYKD